MKLKFICGLSALISCVPPVGAKGGNDASYIVRNGVQYGVASWYGGRNQGRLMACGEPFDEYSMVAAHPTLPLGTEVKVTNLRNGRSVVVRIMDRGPYIAGRAIDLSRAAANLLGFTLRGLAPVRIRVLSTPERPVGRPALRPRRHSLELAASGSERITAR
jgi:rare lipoprotein A